MYEAHFRCPVKFKSNQNALIFSKADIELPFITYNPDLLATVAPQLEAELAEQLAQRNFSEQAKGILKRLLAGAASRHRRSRKRATHEHSNIAAATDRAGHIISAFCWKRPVVNWPVTTCSIRLGS